MKYTEIDIEAATDEATRDTTSSCLGYSATSNAMDVATSVPTCDATIVQTFVATDEATNIPIKAATRDAILAATDNLVPQ